MRDTSDINGFIYASMSYYSGIFRFYSVSACVLVYREQEKQYVDDRIWIMLVY